MRSSRRALPALLPLLLVLVVAAATCGQTGTVGFAGTVTAQARASMREPARGAGPLARVATGTFRKKLNTQAFDSGRATTHVSAMFEGLGMVGATRGGTLFAVQRRGTSSIDPTGQLVFFEYRGAERGWTERPIYDSEWDDRNAAGGVTSTGTIVAFFARYDSHTGIWHDMGFIRSTDDGQSWSDYKTVPVGADRWYSPYGKLVELPGGRLMQLLYGNDGYSYRVRAIFSDDDGETWGNEVTIDRQSFERPTEADAILVDGTTNDNARLIVVSRTEPGPNPQAGGGLYQYVSANGGRTWKRMGFMNVGDTPSDISPWLTNLSDGRIALVWAARRTMTIEVSIADGARVFRNRNGWGKPYTLFTSRLANQRPRQAANFGYPAIGTVGQSDEDQVVIFFDANSSDPSVFHEKAFANTDLVMIRLLGPKIAERKRLEREAQHSSS
ncbi:MAG TPA: sialidase family protein [Actinomycetota bacterium]|nr:sialidase family protein [Actinomycetota bacterium]